MRNHNLSHPFIKFSKEGEIEAENNEDDVILGYNARAEYEDVINQNFEKYAITKATVLPSHKSKRKHTRKSIIKPTLSNINILLREIQNENVDQVRKILKEYRVNINDTDEYGWTPLMCACCAGNIDIVSILLELKPDLYVTDRKCNTAITLAKKNKHYEILKLLTKSHELERTQSIMQQTDDSVTSANITFCDLCKKYICDRDLDFHARSNAHVYQEKIVRGVYPITMTKMHTFSIQRSNKGYQMLLRNGWNGNCGLGPEGKGVIKPIKPIMKKDRKGLGLKIKNSHRIEHEKNDSSSIEQCSVKNKRAEEKIKEISLRRMLA